MRIIHVSTAGSPHAAGTSASPYQTIQQGCDQAGPGDVVEIHEGVYREWVAPKRSGSSEHNRVTIRAAADEKVQVKGSEILRDWQMRDDGFWACVVRDDWFSGTNTLRTQLGGDWFWHERLPQCLGEIFLDGEPLVEVASHDDLLNREPWPKAVDPDCTRLAWYVEEHADHCVVVADFGGADPNVALVEISVREACLYPKQNGVNWITVQGIEFSQAASPWAPPTAEQVAMVGPNWAKGWIIEDCHLHHARCSAISLGATSFIGDNRWTREQVKHGTQREREVIFLAQNNGWSRENIGSHLVRRNHIHDCEQTAICGHLGAIFSTITENHIHDIHVRRRFGGHEMAGIKLHAPIDCEIAGNHIHDCVRGIWLDWQAQGTHVHRNLVYNSGTEDFYIEVSHGPCIVEHNVFLSQGAVKNCSQGTAFVHNLIAGSVSMQPIPNRFTPYHFPHSTAVMGLMTILGGDDRWINNLFLSPTSSQEQVVVEDENANLAKAASEASPYGLGCYDDWPSPDEDWMPSGGVNAYAVAKLPVMLTGNAFTPGTLAGRHNQDAVQLGGRVQWHLDHGQSATCLEITGLDALPAVKWITKIPGQAFQTESPFEAPHGGRIGLTIDLAGEER